MYSETYAYYINNGAILFKTEIYFSFLLLKRLNEIKRNALDTRFSFYKSTLYKNSRVKMGIFWKIF